MNKILAAVAVLGLMAGCGQRGANHRAKAEAANPNPQQAPQGTSDAKADQQPRPDSDQVATQSLLAKMAGCFGLKEEDVAPAEELTAQDVDQWCSAASKTQFAAGIQDQSKDTE